MQVDDIEALKQLPLFLLVVWLAVIAQRTFGGPFTGWRGGTKPEEKE